MTESKRKPSKITEARDLGRDEGAAWAVACLVKLYGVSTEAMELALGWGMSRLLKVADATDRPHLLKLCKSYPNQFSAALRAERKERHK